MIFRVRKSATSDSELLKAEKELAALNKELAWEASKAAVDLAGIVDPTPISDTISMAMSLADGDLVGAGLSLISVVPYFGDALGKGGKAARAAKKIAALKKKIGAITTKIRALEAAKGAKASKAASKTIQKAQSKAAASGVCVECAKRATKKKAKPNGRNLGKQRLTEKRPPNPHGRHGSPAHRSKVKQRAGELKQQGHKILAGGGRKPEKAIRTVDGRKRYPDITSRGPDGKIYHENIGRLNKAGDPVSRERKALDDIEAATGKRPHFTPYRPKKSR